MLGKVKIGTLLCLERELDNRYDQNAVAVVYDRPYPAAEDETPEREEFLLGYIPARENETIAQLLEMGWTDVFECRIKPVAHYEDQIRLTIRIKRNSL